MNSSLHPTLPVQLALEKWHGAHNDFLFLSLKNLKSHYKSTSYDAQLERLAVSLTSRLSGIGADGLVVWDIDEEAGLVFAGIWNSDGSRANTCGNALRCFAALLLEKGLWIGAAPVQVFPLEFSSPLAPEHRQPFATLISSAVQQDTKCSFQASVDMGTVTEVSSRLLSEIAGSLGPEFGCEQNWLPSAGTFVQLANPHFVLHVPRGFIAQNLPAGIEKLGRFFQSEDVCRQLQIPVSNIGFIETEPDDLNGAHAGVVYERGAGLTQCCGSGGCAMFLSFERLAQYNDLTGLQIAMPGGTISVNTDEAGSLVLSGPAQKVGELQAKLWL